MAATISFNAMCAFKQDKNKDPVTVYLPTEKGAHRAAIIAPTRGTIEVDKTTWKPEYLGYMQVRDSLGNLFWTQVAVWPLDAQQVTIDGAGPVTWDKRSEALDLRKYHAKAKTKTTDEIVKADPRVTIIEIGDGSLSSDSPLVAGTIEQPKGTKKEDRVFAKRILWTGSTLTLKNGAGEIIKLKDLAALSISNLAAVPHPEGLTHFKEYYGLIHLNGEYPIHVTDKDEEVYDCVPPAPLP
jgi:hypothetical protein